MGESFAVAIVESLAHDNSFLSTQKICHTADVVLTMTTLFWGLKVQEID